MALDDLIRLGIGIADGITKSVQGTVQHRAWTGQDGKGKVTYADPQPLRAIIDLKHRQKATLTGKLVTVIATLTILEVVPPNGAAKRKEPIDPRDQFTLPDGTTGPVLEVPDAPWDPAQGRPFFHQVYLGEIS